MRPLSQRLWVHAHGRSQYTVHVRQFTEAIQTPSESECYGACHHWRSAADRDLLGKCYFQEKEVTPLKSWKIVRSSLHDILGIIMYPWPCYNDLLHKDCSVKEYVINSMEFHNDQQTGLCRTSLDTAAKESSKWGRGGIPLLVIQHGEAAVQKLKTCFKGSCDQMFPFSVLSCAGQVLTMLFLQRQQVNNCRIK